MREKEKLVIGCCILEDNFKKVSFLEPNDFNNHIDKPYRDFFKLIKSTGAKKNIFIEVLSKPESKRFRSLLNESFHMTASNNPIELGVMLLGFRFKKVLADLLSNLSANSKNSLERDLLSRVSMKINTIDIFDLADNIIEYLGVHASESTKSRINSYIQYRDSRVKEAKEVIDGI